MLTVAVGGVGRGVDGSATWDVIHLVIVCAILLAAALCYWKYKRTVAEGASLMNSETRSRWTARAVVAVVAASLGAGLASVARRVDSLSGDMQLLMTVTGAALVLVGVALGLAERRRRDRRQP
jgi:undecaprenyl pyrophosphate phosphatase UppP